jgi:hypothetical protein
MTPTNSSRYASTPGLRIVEVPTDHATGLCELETCQFCFDMECRNWWADILDGSSFPSISILTDYYNSDKISVARVKAIHARILELCKPAPIDADLVLNNGLRLCRGCDKPIESDTYCRKCLEEIEALITAKPFAFPKWARVAGWIVLGIIGYLALVYDLTAIVVQWRAGAR